MTAQDQEQIIREDDPMPRHPQYRELRKPGKLRPPPNHVFALADQQWSWPDDKNLRRFERTEIEELQSLAGALLSDGKLHEAFARVGLKGDFTLAERRAIDARISSFAEAQGWGARDPFLLSLSILLSRHVTVGNFASCHSAAAQQFLSERYFVRDDELGSTTNTDGAELTYRDIFLIARELLKRSAFRSISRENTITGKIHTKYRKITYPILDDIIMKYGYFGNKNTFMSQAAVDLASRIVNNKITSLRSADATKYISIYKETIL